MHKQYIHQYNCARIIDDHTDDEGNFKHVSLTFATKKGTISKRPKCRKCIQGIDTEANPRAIGPKKTSNAPQLQQSHFYNLKEKNAVLMWDNLRQEPFTLILDLLLTFNNQPVL